jgi:single-strand DNA-binding protein
MARSVNKVILIGNLTRDPEQRTTPSGSNVCTFTLATNRSWKTDAGEKKEETDFHRIVAWDKLAELCGKFLVKGRKVYVEGRLQNRSWTGQDGQQKTSAEVVIDDMVLLDSNKSEHATSSATPTDPKDDTPVDEIDF